MDRLIILSICVVIAGALSGGFYAVGTNEVGSTIINRFTGRAWACDHIACYPLPYKKED